MPRSITRAEKSSSSESLTSLEEFEYGDNGEEFDVLDSLETGISFTALYQALHIHEALDVRAQFRQYYEENRKAQAELIFSASSHPLDTYLHNIIGFFVIEHIVLKTTADLQSQVNVYSLWDQAIQRVLANVAHVEGAKEKERFVEVRGLLVGFMRCLEVRSPHDVSS